jgi:SAM-dependent methyltransferase
MRGEGRGPITRDGCAVELYRKFPYRGDLDAVARYMPAGCTVLELGCGTGRLTRPLLAKGHAVTAVDNSLDMLGHVPDAARKVHADIERLDLGAGFDVVLLASNLVNTADDAVRHAMLAACRRHLAPGGSLLFQRFDPAWLRNAMHETFPAAGEITVAVERVAWQGQRFEMSLAYRCGDEVWKHHFAARLLEDDDVELALKDAGFSVFEPVDRRWARAGAGTASIRR